MADVFWIRPRRGVQGQIQREFFGFKRASFGANIKESRSGFQKWNWLGKKWAQVPFLDPPLESECCIADSSHVVLPALF